MVSFPTRIKNLEWYLITGLSNDLLENQSRFKPESVNLLKLFLENLPQPICLVAHNGSRYDYPLLQAELVNTGTVLNMTLQVTSKFIGFSVKIAIFRKIYINVLTSFLMHARTAVFVTKYQKKTIKKLVKTLLVIISFFFQFLTSSK